MNATAVGYTVAPFSGKDYRKNAEKAEVMDATYGAQYMPCAICGRPVQVSVTTKMAVVIDGGRSWGDENSDVNDSGYMGAWPVGNDCHRRFRAPA